MSNPIQMSAHSRRLVFSIGAQRDLDDIALFTRQHYGEHQLERYASDIMSALDHLTRFPNLGGPADDPPYDTRRYPVLHHVIYYEADDKELRVLRILHNRMDAAKAFEDEPS